MSKKNIGSVQNLLNVRFFFEIFFESFAVPSKSHWNEEELADLRGRGGSSSSLQPPPAHQHGSQRGQIYNPPKPQVIPGTSSTLTPIDLSSR